ARVASASSVPSHLLTSDFIFVVRLLSAASCAPASSLLSLHDALPIASARWISAVSCAAVAEFVLKLAICACRSDSSFTEYQVFIPSPLSSHTNTSCHLVCLGFSATE